MFESQVQGAVYYSGSGTNGVQGNITVQESLHVSNSSFTANSVGVPFFSSDLSSCLYVLNARSITVSNSTFKGAPLSSFGLLVVKPNGLPIYNYYPTNYFGSNLSPLIRLRYNEIAQTIDST